MNKPYPRLKVILGFALAGGAATGMVTLLPVMLFSHDRLTSFANFLRVFRENIFGAYAAGTIPATATGLWLACRRCTQARGMSVMPSLSARFFHCSTLP